MSDTYKVIVNDSDLKNKLDQYPELNESVTTPEDIASKVQSRTGIKVIPRVDEEDKTITLKRVLID